MALRISIGQYLPGDSPIHRLDPRAKLVCALVLMVSVFFIHAPLQLGLAWAAILALVACAKVPPRKVLASAKTVLFMLVLLSVFNLFLVRSGQVVAQLGPLVITSGGAWAAVVYSLRLVVAVIAAALLLLTTTPTQLTDALDAMLAPLTRIGLPGHEIAMVFALMLRFIPTLSDEASAIVDAQTVRGGAIGEGSLFARVRAIVPVIIALIASSMRHAEGLARALDARCYEGGASRGHWHPLHMQARDWLALALVAAYVVLLAGLR